MKLSSNKKAQGTTTDLILTIAEFMLILIAVFSIYFFINYWVSDTTFEKNWLSKDVALLTDTIYTAPSNVFELYSNPRDKHGMTASFEEKMKTKDAELTVPRVIIAESEEGAESKWYPFAKSSYPLSLASQLKLKEGMVFSKINNEFKVSSNLNVNLLELECPNIGTKNEPKELLIDAGHGDDLGFTKDNINEGKFIGGLSVALLEKLNQKDLQGTSPFKADGTRKDGIDSNQRLDNKQIMAKNHKMIISLHMGKYDGSLNNAKAYYSIKSKGDIKNKNQKLACLILNKISDLNLDFEKNGMGFDGTSIIPIYEEDYENAVLPDDSVAVLVEIGNIQSENFRKIVASGRWNELVDAVNNGIKEYFET